MLRFRTGFGSLATLLLTACLGAGCGSRTGPLVLEVDDTAPRPDTADSSVDTLVADTFVPDTFVPDTTPPPDTTVPPDTTPPPDTFVPDTSVDLGPDAVVTGLTIDPLDALAFIDTAGLPVITANVDYHLTATLSDGSTVDVTAAATCSLEDPSLGFFTGSFFTSTKALPSGALGAYTRVRCTALGFEASTSLTLVSMRRTGDHRDFFFQEPFGGGPSPARDVLRFGTFIKQVDVALSVDTTGSMSSSIKNIKDSLSATVFPGLIAAIPSAGIAVAYHDDYPFGGHGTPGCASFPLVGDVPEGTVQVVTTDVALAQSAVDKLAPHCGGDEPEAQVPSMFQIVSGKGLSWPGGSVSPHAPAPGTFGGVDFRPGSVPVVIEITDAHYHDPTFDPYTDLPTAPTIAADLIPAMKASAVKLVGVFDTHYITYEDQEDLISDATDSHVLVDAFGGSCGVGQCCTLPGGGGRPPTGPGGSCRLNFQIRDGVGLGDSIVKAIQAISVGTIFDVTAVASNDPANPDGVDATRFIGAIRAMDEGSAADGCSARAAVDTDGDGIKDTFTGVVVGSPVCFEVVPKVNDTVTPRPTPQFFDAFIDVLGMPGAVKLDRRTVIFEVPPG